MSARARGLVSFTLLGAIACGPSAPTPTVASTASHAAASVAPTSSATPAATPAPIDPLATPPGAEGTVTFTPPKIEEAKLANGMRVLFVERHELPIVTVQLVSDRGADQVSPGTCAFMAAMLTQGTKKHGALAFSDEVERIGATFGAGCTFDGVSLGGKVLSGKLPQLVGLLAEVARTPAFEPNEIERERKKRLTTLAQQHDSPGAQVWRLLQGALYPAGNPYATPTIGDEAAVKGVKRADLVAARAATLGPQFTTIVVAGDVTRATLLPTLDKALGDWKETAPPPAASPTRDTPGLDPRIVILDRPGAPQSTLQVARIGVARDPATYAQVLLTNYVFGGHFASRLNMNLREAHAYTYGAGSSFQMWHRAGPFTAGGEIKTDKTADALKEILAELTRMGEAPISDEELAEAQSGLIDQLPGRFATLDDTVSSLAMLATYHFPLDEYATRPARLRAITKADVQRIARASLRVDDLRVFIVGDASKIEGPLTALGLGRIEVRRKS